MAGVSVVIPAYNAAATISRALRSVYAQTFPADEVIVVDDGSTDGTAEVVRAEFPKVRLIQQANSGPSAARNAGIQTSKGRWIAFLDADDRWLPWKLQRQMAVFEADGDIALVACRAYILREGDVHLNMPEDHDPAVDKVGFLDLLQDNMFSTPSVVARADVLHDLGGFDPGIPGSEDFDLWLRIASRYPILRLRSKLIEVYIRPSSCSHDVDRMTRGELMALAKWAPDLANESTAAIARGRYESIMQRWRLKHALRSYTAGDRTGGRAHLIAALGHGFRRPHQVIAILLGLIFPRAFLTVGTLARVHSHRALLGKEGARARE